MSCILLILLEKIFYAVEDESKGLRIPKPILEQTGIINDVEIEVEKNHIIIRPVKNIREGWDKAFKMMREKGDDAPLIYENDVSNSWDMEEWQW